MRTKTHEPKRFRITFITKNNEHFGGDLSTIDEVLTMKKRIKAFLETDYIVSITIKKGWEE